MSQCIQFNGTVGYSNWCLAPTHTHTHEYHGPHQTHQAIDAKAYNRHCSLLFILYVINPLIHNSSNIVRTQGRRSQRQFDVEKKSHHEASDLMIHNVKALEDYENEWQQQKYVKSFYWSTLLNCIHYHYYDYYKTTAHISTYTILDPKHIEWRNKQMDEMHLYCFAYYWWNTCTKNSW